MSVDIVPGIRRVKLRDHEKLEGTDDGFYYAFNLQELPEEFALGLDDFDPAKPTLRDYWSDEMLARVLFDPPQSDFILTELEAETADVMKLYTFDIIDGCPLNDLMVGRARFEQGFRSTVVDEYGVEMGPTIIYVSESRLRSTTRDGCTDLSLRYQALVRTRRYVVEVASNDVVKQLEKFYIEHVVHVRRWNERILEKTKPIRQALSRVHNAHLAVTAMIDFAEPPSVRRELWGTTEPREDEPWVFSRDLLPHRPTKQQISNARSLRDNSLELLAKNLSQTLIWMNSGAEHQGKVYELAHARNTAARRLLDELRSDPLILTMLEEHERVPYGQWLMLEMVLVEAFMQIGTAPDVLSDLLGSEALAMMRVAARRDIDIEPQSGGTLRERELSQRISTFVPETELKEKETELSKRLIELFGKTDSIKSHTDTFVRLWASTLTPMLHEVGRKAQDIGQIASVTKRCVLFRSVLGASKKEEYEQKTLWESLNRIAKTRDKRKAALEVFDRETGSLQNIRRQFDSERAWRAFKGAVALFAVYETLADGEKKPAMYAIDGVKAILDASSAGLEFAETLVLSPTFMKAASHRGEGLFEALDRVSEKSLFKGIGIATAWVDLVGSVLAASAVDKSKTKTTTEKEMAAEKIMLSGLQLAMTMLTTATGVAMPVAMAILFVGQTLLSSRDKWMASVLPGVEALPGPGRYVRGVWKSIVEDKEFAKQLKSCPWGGQINQMLDRLGDATFENAATGRGNFWPLGAGKLVLTSLVKGILIRQYGLGQEAAAQLAE